LDVVEKVDAPAEFFSAFADVLQDGSRKESHGLNDDLMSQGQRVAVRIWDLALKSDAEEVKSHGDWLGIAINRPGGKLAEFWLQRISIEKKLVGENWTGIPEEIKGSLTEILRGTSGEAACARTVFGSQLHYFFSLDASFTMTEILPLFNWRADESRAEQCWHGFLFWGRWLAGFTEQLLPYFTETISRIGKMSDRVREALIHQVAGVALFRLENPLANDWFPNVLLQFEDKDLSQLAATIDRYLGDVETSITEKIWGKWLADYWKMRLTNKPKAVVAEEGNEMGCWPFSLGRFFPDAVKLTMSMKGIITFEHTPIFLRLDEKKELVRNYPDATADLILFYFQCPLKYFFNSEQVKSVWQELRQTTIAREKLNKIREAMFKWDADPGAP
jgi:hypothetical protein